MSPLRGYYLSLILYSHVLPAWATDIASLTGLLNSLPDKKFTSTCFTGNIFRTAYLYEHCPLRRRLFRLFFSASAASCLAWSRAVAPCAKCSQSKPSEPSRVDQCGQDNERCR